MPKEPTHKDIKIFGNPNKYVCLYYFWTQQYMCVAKKAVTMFNREPYMSKMSKKNINGFKEIEKNLDDF